MSNQKSVAELITFFLDKYHSGEFSKIDCNFTLHKKDDQIQKLQSALLEEKQKAANLIVGLQLLYAGVPKDAQNFIDQLIKKYGNV